MSGVLAALDDVLSTQTGMLADEFEALREARAAVAALIDAASEIRTSLSLTRSNVMTEIKRGSNQWDGVPEILQARIETFDAALARVTGGVA